MKKQAVICLMLALLMLSACAEQNTESVFGFAKDDFTVMAEVDTHGGFLGDGLYYLHLDCSENREQAMELVQDWAALPLSENLSLIMYGGKRDGMQYSYHLAEKAGFPVVENGFYYFSDRHSQSTDSADDTALFDRSSFNFSLAVYDSDNDVLYYMEFDT